MKFIKSGQVSKNCKQKWKIYIEFKFLKCFHFDIILNFLRENWKYICKIGIFHWDGKNNLLKECRISYFKSYEITCKFIKNKTRESAK